MSGTYNLAKLKRVKLRHFTLFKKGGVYSEIDEEINDGVYCLAGANGLGKTTFLNTINYAITGLILEPYKIIASPQEIISNNKKFTERYYQGRIAAEDRSIAEIEVEIEVNNKIFRIVKGFTNREELKLFQLYSNGTVIESYQEKDFTNFEINKHYQDSIVRETGLVSFNYFIFIQLYILTFDESRRLLFWDERASSFALSLVFNLDPEATTKMSHLLREIEKYDSDARNARWQATRFKKKAIELQKDIGRERKPAETDMQNEYIGRTKEIDELEELQSNIEFELDTLRKELSIVLSDTHAIKQKIDALFASYSQPRTRLVNNDLVVQSINNNTCCLCDAQGSVISSMIEKAVSDEYCPLCKTKIGDITKAQAQVLDKIILFDAELSEKNALIDSLQLSINDKSAQFQRGNSSIEKLRRDLEKFLDVNVEVDFKSSSDSQLNSLVCQYNEQYRSFEIDSKKAYGIRDKLRKEYLIMMKETEKAMQAAELEFVPIFQKLAFEFIGLDIYLRTKSTIKAIMFVLEFEKTARTEATQLSESQRFFLDIALRMALAIQLSKNGNPVTMLIDTPEGSLDIAYENRVGMMFAKYCIEFNQNIFMISNINSSQLLVSLAETCKRDKMKFRRMMEWKDLSIVHVEGEELFTEVCKNLESILHGE